MSSGQKRVQFNNSERVVSDDHNKLQDAIYQNLAEMMRALLQRSYSPANAPGVSIRETGAYPAQFPGYVLDGLEMVVDIPGWVLITPGTLAGWLTPPTDAARDTGFAIINDVGVSGTGDPFSPDMQIAVNAGSFPRCDIIECSVWVDANQVTASVDVYDPGTELFVPATLPKQYSSQLRYRVRQGTPGVAPVREAGWLILGLAIVQPGATVAQVDFYDCRPLWRAMGEGSDSPDQIVNGAQVNLQSGHFVECSGGVSGTAFFIGNIEVEFNGRRTTAITYRNSPSGAAHLATFGSVAGVADGDSNAVVWNAENSARGSGITSAAGQTLALCCYMPTLGDGYPLPRCVRYVQNVANRHPSAPVRRRPQGCNGILQIINIQQEVVDFNATRVIQTVLQSSGIQGVLGTCVGYPIAFATIGLDGITAAVETTGIGKGFTKIDGVPIAIPPTPLVLHNQIIDMGTLLDSGVDFTTTSTSPVSVTGTFSGVAVNVGDLVEFTVGPMYFSTVAGNYTDNIVEMHITQGAGGSSPITEIFSYHCFNTNGTPIPIPIPITLHVARFASVAGAFTFELFAKGAAGTGLATRVQVAGDMMGAGSYRVTRPNP